MTPTDKLSEIDNPLERIDELTAERDRFGDRIDDLAAEVIRLRADLADRDKTIAELVAANTRLVGLVEGARRIIDFTMSYIPAAFVDWHDVCRKWMEESK